MDLDIGGKKVLNLKYDGESYKLRFPSVLEAKSLAQKAKDVSEEDSIDLLIDMVVKLGLPREVVETLDVEQLEKIVNELMPNKKK